MKKEAVMPDLVKDKEYVLNCVKEKNVQFRELPDADHTFSSQKHRTKVEEWTQTWVSQL